MSERFDKDSFRSSVEASIENITDETGTEIEYTGFSRKIEAISTIVEQLLEHKFLDGNVLLEKTSTWTPAQHRLYTEVLALINAYPIVEEGSAISIGLAVINLINNGLRFIPPPEPIMPEAALPPTISIGWAVDPGVPTVEATEVDDDEEEVDEPENDDDDDEEDLEEVMDVSTDLSIPAPDAGFAKPLVK